MEKATSKDARFINGSRLDRIADEYNVAMSVDAKRDTRIVLSNFIEEVVHIAVANAIAADRTRIDLQSLECAISACSFSSAFYSPL